MSECPSPAEDTAGQESSIFMAREPIFACLVALKNYKRYSFYYICVCVTIHAFTHTHTHTFRKDNDLRHLFHKTEGDDKASFQKTA